MIKIIGIFGLVLLAVLGFKFGTKWWSVWQAENYDDMLDALYAHTVPTIKSQALQAANVHLLDSRSPEEYAVSHLEGAIFFDYANPPFEQLESVDAEDTIVVYCSVGYRSEKIGEKLLAMGYKNVFNLYGGIFAWANQQKRIVGPDKQPTRRLHCYSKTWAKWLDSSLDAVF